jgi:hypothetical protein
MKQTGFNKIKIYSAIGSSRPQTTGRLFFVIVLGGFISLEVRSDDAYLPCVGPPILRFETNVASDMQSTAKIFSPAAVKNGIEDFAPIESFANTTNVISTVAASIVITNSSSSDSSPAIFMPAASDNSVVTLQMLTDYLKPMVHGSIFVPINIGFTPPTPTIIQPSKAVYKSE